MRRLFEARLLLEEMRYVFTNLYFQPITAKEKCNKTQSFSQSYNFSVFKIGVKRNISIKITQLTLFAQS